MLAKLEDTTFRALTTPAQELDAELKYYVLLTEPQGEKRAAPFLRRQGFLPYVPMFSTIRRYQVQTSFGGRFTRERKVHGPIFPGYMFLPLNVAWSFGPIHACPGLRQAIFLVQDGQIRALSETEIASIRRIEEAVNSPESKGLPYKIGERVRILDGPFADRMADIARLDDAERIELLLDFLGQKTRVYASARQIEPQ